MGLVPIPSPSFRTGKTALLASPPAWWLSQLPNPSSQRDISDAKGTLDRRQCGFPLTLKGRPEGWDLGGKVGISQIGVDLGKTLLPAFSVHVVESLGRAREAAVSRCEVTVERKTWEAEGGSIYCTPSRRQEFGGQQKRLPGEAEGGSAQTSVFSPNTSSTKC